MRILITGADGFIGKNLKAELINRKYKDVHEINDCNNIGLLKKYIEESDFIFHLMTIYRSDDDSVFEFINTETTRRILESIGNKHKSLLLLSSVQTGNSSAYGRSKMQAEKMVKEWMSATENKAYIFRLNHEFGKWCPPNLNSVVGTFCNNITRGMDIQINDPNAPLNLMYIDDIINCFISVLENGSTSVYGKVEPVYNTTVGEVAKIIKSFHSMRAKNDIPNIENSMIKKLFSTYLSYLPSETFSIGLRNNVDLKGSFTELFHFGVMGQVSINISKPGTTKGNHWHHTKNEKFVVVSGIGLIQLRKIGEKEIIEYNVSGDKMEIVDIPPGYTHNIKNTGETDLFTIIWANEIYNIEKPDTYFEEV